jgi:hypothetical protein
LVDISVAEDPIFLRGEYFEPIMENCEGSELADSLHTHGLLDQGRHFID